MVRRRRASPPAALLRRPAARRGRVPAAVTWFAVGATVALAGVIAFGIVDSVDDEDERAALDPWVFGMIGAAFAAVRRWLERPVRAPGLETFTAILSESITAQINGMSTARGLNLPDLPLSDLMRMWTGAASADADEGT